jgi:hypothetical protein
MISRQEESSNEFVNKPIWGLPASFLELDNGSPRIINLVGPYGLNRTEKKRILTKFSSKTVQIPDAISSNDAGILSIWASPSHRFTWFWRAVKQLRGPTRRAASGAVLMAPDLAILLSFDKEFLHPKIDRARLSEIPRWEELTASIRLKLPNDFPSSELEVLVTWIKVEERLKIWNQLSRLDQQRVSDAIFAISSATGGSYFLTHAIELCPELKGHLFPMALQIKTASTPLVEPQKTVTVDTTKALPTTAVETLEDLSGDALSTKAMLHETSSDEEKEWLSLIAAAKNTVHQLETEPSIEGTAQLLSLASQLNEKAPLITRGSRIAAAMQELFELARKAAEFGPTQDGSSEFEVLNTAVLEAIELAWRRAQTASTSSHEERVFEADIERAVNEGTTALQQCHEFSSKVASLEHELQSVAEKLRVTNGPNARLSLATTKRQHASELSEARDALTQAEHELLHAICPNRDTSSLEEGRQETTADSIDITAETEPLPTRTELGTNSATEAHFVAEPEAFDPPTSSAEVTSAGEPDNSLSEKNRSECDAPEEEPMSEELVHEAAINASTETGNTLESALNRSTSEIFIPTEEACLAITDERCGPIWSALERNQAGLAYWMARAVHHSPEPLRYIRPELLGAVALSGHVLTPDGEISQRLEMLYREFDESWFDADPETPPAWTRTMNWLLFSSVLRPILLCPKSGASGVAGFLHLGAASLHQVRQTCEDFAQRAQGFHLEAATFKTPRESAEWQRQVDVVKEEAQAWLERAPSMKMLFQAASQVWQQWLKTDGLIWKMLTPVAQGQSENLESVSRVIASVSTANALERLIQESDRRSIGKRGNEIHTRALSQMSSRVQEAIHLARRWIALEEQRPKKTGTLHRLIDDLRIQVLPLISDSIQELQSEESADDLAFVSTARQQAVRSLRSLQDLLDAEISLPLEESNPDKVLGRDLALAQGLDVDTHWLPTTDSARLEELLRTAIEDGVDASTAFKHRIKTHDLLNAERVLDSESRADRDVDDLRLQLNEELRTHREMLHRQLNAAQEEVETGLALGLIAEADRAAFDGTLIEIRTQADAIRNFGPELDKLEKIFCDLKARRAGQIESATHRFENLSDANLGEVVISEIRSSIESGDMLTANEYLQRLESGEPIHASSLISQDVFAQYFPTKSGAIDQALTAMDAQAVHGAVSKGGRVGPLDFALLSEPRRKDAADALNSWYGIRKTERADRSGTKMLLQALGLTVSELEAKGGGGGRQEYSVRALPIEDRSICPIPYFGSRAKGNYRVICVWPRPAEEEVVKIVGDTSLSTATIMLYFGRLSNRRRTEESRFAREQQRSFLLVDESLFLFLLSSTGSPIATTFSTALPFTYSQPYEPTSGVVPTEMFFGRQQELQAVQDLNGRCFIYGGRQLGKTALLRKAERDFHSPSNARFAKWIDLRAEGIGSNRGSTDIWTLLRRDFIKFGILTNDVPEPSATVKGRVERFLEALKSALESDPHRRILLLLDEADSFFEHDGREDFIETRRLRELMTATEQRFKVVFAGLHNVLRTTELANHPLAHLGEPIKVGPLLASQEWRDAEDLVRGPFEAAGFRFANRSLVTRILAQTNYYPSLIQLYCHHLLRHMLEAVRLEVLMKGPRYEIRPADVDAVYRKPNLREEIRSKFQLTLQLDTRYEVITYSIAYESLAGLTPVAEGLSVWSISEKARGWWPLGFDRTSEAAFRVLLDEMVGLGVLRRTDAGNYSLRNPNVLLLLGNSEDVADVLVREREMPVEFEPDTFRARMPNDDGPERHPLTFVQRRSYSHRHSGVSVAFGSRALCLDRLISFLKSDRDCDHIQIVSHADSRKEFQQTFEAISGARQTGHTLLIVPSTAEWDSEMVRFTQKSTARLTSKDRTLHVLFVADPQKSWQLATDPSLFEQINRIELRQWSDNYVRQWLNDQELASTLIERNSIQEAIGYWPMLLQQLGKAKGTTLKTKLHSFKERLKELRSTSFDTDFGLDVVEPTALLREMASSDIAETAEDLSILTSMDQDLVNQSLAWAKAMHLVQCDVNDRWSLDPLITLHLKQQAAASALQWS